MLARVIRRSDIRGEQAAGRAVDYAALVPRAELDVDAAIVAVRPLVEAVRQDGHAELLRQAAVFDGVEITRVRVPANAMRTALSGLDATVRRSLEDSIERLRASCLAELPRDVETVMPGGGRVTSRNVPIERVGLYVPGAKAPLVSSVVMNVVPAQVAGVSSLALASPAQREYDGLPHPTILAACALLGIDEVYAAGGAGAIAMFAYGFAHEDGGCRPVDLITGPPNIYGVAAKRLVRGVVGIDAEAGPTEIAVLADVSADPRFVAADLVSQAEHDAMAASVLVTDSAELADSVERELERQVPAAKHVERIRAALGGPQSAVVLVDDIAQGLRVVNAYAPEHLEIHTRGRGGGRGSGPQCRCGVRRPPCAGLAGRLLRRVQPRAADRRLRLLLRRGCPCGPSSRPCRSSTIRQPPWRRRPTQVLALAEAEDLPAHGEAVRVRLDRA